MSRRFIDISVALEDVPMNPPHHRPKIEYAAHDDTWEGFGVTILAFQRKRLLTARLGRARLSPPSRTAAHIWMRPGTITRL